MRQLGELGRRDDAGDLRRFAVPKREALVACYLIEARRTLLDQLVDMHDQFLTTMARRSRLAVEERHRKLRRRARDGLHRVPGAIDALHAADGNQTVGDFRASIDAPRLLEAAATWREYERLEERGLLDAMLARYVNLDLIAEQWDQLVRIVASLKDRTAPADVLLQRLINAAPADRLAKALTALGSLVKTIHILRYIRDAPLRHAIQLQLNRGEFRHILAKWLFFANQGDFRVGDYEEIMNKASCLSLLSDAVLVWNTVHIARIVAQLRAGGHEVKDADLARVSPLLHAHTVPSGSYFQSPRRRSDLVPEPVTA